jgi:7-carboxy-7-deazaguanine synthase
VNWVTEAEAKLVVITGGEPSMYDLTLAYSRFKRKATFVIHIETAAPYLLKGQFDWVTISPKRYSLPLEENMLKAHDLKVIINHRNDFRFAEEYAS